MAVSIGDTFAGYRVLGLLGSGGMGEVYLVQHPRLPRREALKVLRPDVSQDPSFRERFTREADLASGLRHPHIVGIHDRGEHDGQLWIAMDYIEGADLSHLLQDRYPQGIPVGYVLPILSAVASALDYAHTRKLLHRDVKPANIIVADLDTDDPKTFLADFGIARPIDDNGGITTTNMTVGTVAYAAPEQLMGEQMDGRADLYALAATTHHLLTGSQPFLHSNPAVVISHHLSSPPPVVSRTHPELRGLDGVLARGLAKKPDDRYSTCGSLAQALANGANDTTADGNTRSAATVMPIDADLEAVRSSSHPPAEVITRPRTSAASNPIDSMQGTIWDRHPVSISVLSILAIAASAAVLFAALADRSAKPQELESSGSSTSDVPGSAPLVTSIPTPPVVAPPPASTSAAPSPPAAGPIVNPPEGYFTDIRQVFSGWNGGQGIGDTTGTRRVLNEVFDWVCKHQDTDPDVVNRQIQMQETWFNHPSLELYEANRLRSIAMSYCSNTSGPVPITTTPAITPYEGMPCTPAEFNQETSDGTLYCSAMTGAWRDKTHQSRPAVQVDTPCTEPGARARVAQTDGLATCKASASGYLVWSW